MRPVVLSILIVLSTTIIASAAPPPGYELVWADEFTGDTLDLSRWIYRLSGPRRDAINTPNAVGVTNDLLVIKTYTVSGTNYTGMIATEGQFHPRYGYIEAKIDFDDSPGMWSAFWMQSRSMGNPVGDPASAGTEIDICEHRRQDSGGRDVDGSVVINIHWDGYGADHKSIGSGLTGSGLGSGFHTYALEWTPDSQRFYIDGVYQYGCSYPVSCHDEFIILSSEVQNNSWAGTIPAGGYGDMSTTATRMRVDYVRVYHKPPTLSAIADRIIPENSDAPPIRFTVDDVEEAPYDITVWATLSSQGLFPADALVLANVTNAWISQDIGAVGKQGSTHISGGGITVVGSGADVGSSSDTFRYVHQPLAGDGEIRVLVRRLQNTAGNAKAGVMIRESTSADSAYAYVFLTPSFGVGFECRTSTGANAVVNGSAGGVTAPHWLRLMRVGDTFTASGASDHLGTPGAWNPLGTPQTIAMNSDTRIGLAVTAHDNAALCNALFTGAAGTLVTGGERVLAPLRPLPDRSGTATISVVADDGALQATHNFNLTVEPVQDSSRLVSAAATWRYFDTGTTPAADWMNNDFDDHAWPTGEAQLGFGDGDEFTLIAADSARVTTYFRHAFAVSDPLAWSGLTVKVLRDDGAVVYLNGHEVFRSNMPEGVVEADTSALSSASPADETSRFYSGAVSTSRLRAGTNLVAAEIHQFGTNSDDLSFNLQLFGTNPAPTVLVTAGAVWKYLDNNQDPGTSWAATLFNDTAWKSGAAQLGYGDDDEFTLVSHGPDPENKYTTAYFRRAFVVRNPSNYVRLLVRLLRDDGGVVYLNGTEVFRSNMPTGTITRATPASSRVTGFDEERFVEAAVAPSLLVRGRNVLAVEVHQYHASSSDLSFDLELRGYEPAALPELRADTATGTLALQWPAWDASWGLFTATNLSPPTTWWAVTNVPLTTNGLTSVTLPTESGPRFYRLQRQ